MAETGTSSKEGIQMKNFAAMRSIAIIAMAAVIGFSMAACSNGAADEDDTELITNTFTGKTADGKNIEFILSNKAIDAKARALTLTSGNYVTKVESIVISIGLFVCLDGRNIQFTENSGAVFFGELLNLILTVSGQVGGQTLSVQMTVPGSGTTPGGVGGGTIVSSGGGGNGTLTITDIPSEYNGKYIGFGIEFDNDVDFDNIDQARFIFGGQSININTGWSSSDEDPTIYTLARIANGRAVIPVWEITFLGLLSGRIPRYGRTETFENVTVYIDEEGVYVEEDENADLSEDAIAVIVFPEIAFKSGSATVSYNDRVTEGEGPEPEPDPVGAITIMVEEDPNVANYDEFITIHGAGIAHLNTDDLTAYPITDNGVTTIDHYQVINWSTDGDGSKTISFAKDQTYQVIFSLTAAAGYTFQEDYAFNVSDAFRTSTVVPDRAAMAAAVANPDAGDDGNTVTITVTFATAGLTAITEVTIALSGGDDAAPTITVESAKDADGNAVTGVTIDTIAWSSDVDGWTPDTALAVGTYTSTFKLVAPSATYAFPTNFQNDKLTITDGLTYPTGTKAGSAEANSTHTNGADGKVPVTITLVVADDT